MNHQVTAGLLIASMLVGSAAAQSGGPDPEPTRARLSWADVKNAMRATMPSKAAGLGAEKAPSTAPVGQPETCKCCGQRLPSRQSPSTESAQEVVVLSLEGTFTDVDGLCGYIAEDCVKVMIDLAMERDPAALILDIDSPGGLVSTMQVVIERLLEVQTTSRTRVIAWPKLAGSAAAITCMACKEIIPRPTTVMGAATKIYSSTGEAVEKDETALGMKIASVDEAKSRRIAQITGRAKMILDAMQHPEKKLFYSQAGGFSAEAVASAMAIDDSREMPATFSADELVETRIARGKASTIEDLIKLAGLPTSARIIRIDPCSEQFQAKLKPYFDSVDKWEEWSERQVDKFRLILQEQRKRCDATLENAGKLSSARYFDRAAEDRLIAQINNLSRLPSLPDSIKKQLSGTRQLLCIESLFPDIRSHLNAASHAARSKPDGDKVITSYETVYKEIETVRTLIQYILDDCPPQDP